ncbi:MAG: hypothetical protein JXR77_06230 [Lentisphaeria bacterium]|nr:hypothetical protein [Lentisphaeria bacterium]
MAESTGDMASWRFFRAGGMDQLKLDSGAVLARLSALDQKLWVALSCPVNGLEFDPKTLALIDTDADGRVRVPEILAAVQWACANLRDPDALLAGGAELPLAAINDASDEGKGLLASAREILRNLGKPDATAVSVADTADTARIFAQTRFNGDGVVPAAAADGDATRTVITDIIAGLGGEPDRSGAPGVNQAKLDAFYAALQAFSDWRAAAEGDRDGILPLGDGTAAAHGALGAVRAKIDDYFARCRLIAFDIRAAASLNRAESDFAALAAQDLSTASPDISAFPIAKAEAGKPVPLGQGVNPAWVGPVNAFHKAVVTPLLGAEKTELTEEEWVSLKARFAAYEGWQAAKAGAAVEGLGLTRVQELLAGDGRQAVTDLIARDKALEPQMNAIVAVDRLVRYYRDLACLLNNFVAFRDFYSREKKSVFQAGTLYIDGRSCDLCVRVADMAKHGALAGLSRCYLLYCDCTGRVAGDKMTIAAAVTGGDADNLMVGRNGVFYDRLGRDWDATVTKIVENPISIRQAILMPYKKFGAMIGAQIEKIAAAREKSVQDRAAAQVTAAAAAAEKPPAGGAAAAPSLGIAGTVGILAAVGLALGAIGTAVAALGKAFLGLAWWQMPLAILGILVLISGPSMVIAWLKLRQRNLGPILDANGWAINGRAKISIAFGGILTQLAKLPPGTRRVLDDPLEREGRRLRILILVGLALIAITAVVAFWVLKAWKPVL